jgi:YidC/Oxa1 family membrane protein insertase
MSVSQSHGERTDGQNQPNGQEKTEETESKVRNLLEQKDAYHDRIEKFVEEYVYNLGNSAEVGAKYIVQAVQEQIKKAKEQ